MAYVCYKKLSKKKQREIDRGKRATWGSVSPVTKKVESAKAYNRKKIQRRQRKSPPLDFLCKQMNSPCMRAPISG